MKPIIFLHPVFKQMIWGGNRLATDFGYDIPAIGPVSAGAFQLIQTEMTA